MKEWHGLLSNSFTGAHQHYLFLYHENNLVPFNYNVVLWSRQGAWGKRGTRVELSTFSICVCINTQKKDTQPTKKNSPREICILRHIWSILGSLIWMFVLPPQIWDMTKPRALHLQSLSSLQLICYCSLMLLIFLNEF